ncbi:MAG: NADH:flavin oxidoreductase [Thermodesulfobacteriota bacterium]|nr:NADH:flavin oxidoreductase [Thermodesulfobacteriota bacterium]
MAAIFEQTGINGLTLRNRLVRSATWEGMCEPDGRPTQGLARFYNDLAKGGVGLIISGYTFVRPEGKQLPGKMGIYTDDFEPQFKALSQAVHKAGGKIAIQMVHAGGQTDSRTIGRKPLAPSAIETPQFPEVPEELTKDEIGEIVTAFGQGAARAKAWGFDAVQMHGAHGYLINQFLSPLTNRREDEYGGSFENRSRFLLEVYTAIREASGPDFPVMIKLNSEDNVEGGLTLEDAILAAKALDAAGIDAIEVSGGTPASGEKTPVRVKINAPEKEAYHLDAALRIKKAVSCPVMVVGGFRSFEVAEKAVQDLRLDHVSMARPLIREPGLPNRWLSGDTSPARCISCNSCFGAGLKEGGIYCVAEKKEREGKA